MDERSASYSRHLDLMQQIAQAQYKLFGRHLGPEGLTQLQYFVLKSLGQVGGPCKISDLSRDISSSPAIMTGVVDRLVRAGLVERNHDERDRRVILVALTERGQGVTERLEGGFVLLLNRFFDRLSDEDHRALMRILEGYLLFLDEQLAMEAGSGA